MTAKEKNRRNEKMAALAMVTFVILLMSAGGIEFAREICWKLGCGGSTTRMTLCA